MNLVFPKRAPKHPLLRLLPLILLVIAILIVYLSGVTHHLSFSELQKEHGALRDYVQQHPFISPLLFIGIYILSVFLVIPDSTLLTLIAGFLFPQPLSLIYVVFSETVGALLFFLCVKLSLSGLQNKKIHFLEKMTSGFQKNAASYLLFLRLSHIIPFWLINIAAGYFRVRLWTFIWTTVIGVIPLAYLFIVTGEDLQRIFASGQKFSLRSVLDTKTQLALFLLGASSFLPLLIKKWVKRK